MKKIGVFMFMLIFLTTACLSAPVKAQEQIKITLNLTERNIVLSNSDIRFIDVEEELVYALVVHQNKNKVFVSEDEGKSWLNVPSYWLPEKESIIGLEVAAENSEILALATETHVFLSRNKGENFESLGSPGGLIERGEKISSFSLAVTEGNPEILVGVWHPETGRFPKDGVYLWGESTGYTWRSQNLCQTWKGNGYGGDVTSLTLFQSVMLVVATGDPDREGPLPEGTYLNLGYPITEEKVAVNDLDDNWNAVLGWPIEISSGNGSSPKENQILNSQLVFPEDQDILEERNFFILLGSSNKEKDGIFNIEGDNVNRLKVPDSESVRLNTVDYYGSRYKGGYLIAGVTIEETCQVYQLEVKYPVKEPEPLDWERKKMGEDIERCQVAFSQNFDENGLIFAATSGKASSFSFSAKGEKVMKPISLIDASGSINQLEVPLEFLEKRFFVMSYGNRHVFKVFLREDCSIDYLKNIFYAPETFNPLKVILDNEDIFIFQADQKKFWQRQKSTLRWEEREHNVNVVDVVLAQNRLWIAGQDGKIYWREASKTSSGISSGMTYIKDIEPAPQGVVVVGGMKQNNSDMLSLVGENFYESPQIIPGLENVREITEVFYSYGDESIYCVGSSLYRFRLTGETWEKIPGPGVKAYESGVSWLGVYLFSGSDVYFSFYPLGNWSLAIKGRWNGFNMVELSKEENLLFLWDNSEILIFPHLTVIPEERPEEIAEPEEVEDVEPVEVPTPEKPEEIKKPEQPKEQPKTEAPVITPKLKDKPVSEAKDSSKPAGFGNNWYTWLLFIVIVLFVMVIVFIIKERRKT